MTDNPGEVVEIVRSRIIRPTDLICPSFFGPSIEKEWAWQKSFSDAEETI